MFNFDNCITLISKNFSKLFTIEIEKRLKAGNISWLQFLMLYNILHQPGITQRQLSHKMSTTEPSIGRQLSDMEHAGLIDRTESPDDRRVRNLQLSPQGQELYQKALPIVEEFISGFKAEISNEEFEVVVRTLNKMSDIIVNLNR